MPFRSLIENALQVSAEWPGLIQALSAAASVVLAYWIARLTSRYAKSTDRILKANEDTLRVLREELNEIRDERRAPIRNVIERLASETNICLGLGLDALTPDQLRTIAPRFSITNNDLIHEVARRSYGLSRTLRLLYDVGDEIKRHLERMSDARSSERADLFASELASVRREFAKLAQLTETARDQLHRY